MMKKLINFLNLNPQEDRNLTSFYIFALSSIALMIIVFQVIKFSGQMKQLELVNDLRVMDKQLFRSSRLVAKLNELQFALEPHEKEKKIEHNKNKTSKKDYSAVQKNTLKLIDEAEKLKN